MGLDEVLDNKPNRKFTYPISIDGYRINWGDWDIIREFISNALDAEDNDWKKIKTVVTSNSLEIHNLTRALDIKDFYIGHSSQSKSISTDYIGRFNEGMKIALIAALRQKYNVVIYFGNIKASAGVVATEDNIRILEVTMQSLKNSVQGTRVKIKGFSSNPRDIMDEKIIFPNDLRVLYDLDSDARNREDDDSLDYMLGFKRKTGLQILSCEGAFVGGMYVCKLEGYSCGYNIAPSVIKMPEGRNFIDVNDLDKLLTDCMQKINLKEYWKKLFQGIKEGVYRSENDVNPFLYDASLKTKKTIRNAWLEVFDENTVPEDTLADEVKYRGGKVVKTSRLLSKLSACMFIPGSLEFLSRYSNSGRIIHKYEEFSEKEKKIYEIISSLKDRYLPPCNLVFYTPTKLAENEYGFYDPVTKNLGIMRNSLKDLHEVVDTLLEEFTHARFNTRDMTREHTDRLRELATTMLLDKFAKEKLSELAEILKSWTN